MRGALCCSGQAICCASAAPASDLWRARGAARRARRTASAAWPPRQRRCTGVDILEPCKRHAVKQARLPKAARTGALRPQRAERSCVQERTPAGKLPARQPHARTARSTATSSMCRAETRCARARCLCCSKRSPSARSVSVLRHAEGQVPGSALKLPAASSLRSRLLCRLREGAYREKGKLGTGCHRCLAPPAGHNWRTRDQT